MSGAGRKRTRRGLRRGRLCPSKHTSRAGRSVEAHHGIGTAVFAGARGGSFFAPANLALWKVDKELDAVVQPPVVDFFRCDVGLLVFVERLPASPLVLPLVPRPLRVGRGGAGQRPLILP